MSLFKNKKKHGESTLIYLLTERLNEAREKHEKCFYYPLSEKDVNYVKDYFMSHYQTVVEPDHKTNNIIVYKFYGYSID